MKKRTRLVMIGSGILAAGAGIAGAVHRTVTNNLVKMALDREMPKRTGSSAEKAAGGSMGAEVVEALRTAAEKLQVRESETVQITGSDGVKLVGHWFACEAPKRVVVAMHGWRSSWNRDFGPVVDFWFENQCSVLIPEQRAQGESGGAYMGFGLLERYDCLDWVNWVNERSGGSLPVYLCGISMGASTVLMAAGLELPENVRGIMADCGYTSAGAIWKHVAQDNLGLRYGIYSAAANDLCRKRIQVGIDDYSCTDAMKVCKVPVLFVHGEDDHFVPVEMTYENYAACAAPKRLFVVPGAEHGMSYFVDKDGYEAAVKSFWNDCEQAEKTP